MAKVSTKLKATIDPKKLKRLFKIGGGILVLLVGFYFIATADFFPIVAMGDSGTATSTPPAHQLDKAAYDQKLLQIAKVPTSTWAAYLTATTSNPAISLPSVGLGILTTLATSTRKSITNALWPVQNLPYPNYGALLPQNRIVAYYGNFYSTGMGILGQNPPDVMIPQLEATVAQWQAADPSTPVIPAIDYIVITAQGSPGKDGMYRARMPEAQVDKALELAKEVNGIVILDVQVGLSNLQTELPQYENYFKMPNVELAIDPEFAMHNGQKPGDYIGSYSSSDVNFAANYLANLVKEYNLPPKILVVHRFTGPMVTGYQNIKPLPEVQIVMDMDGWGSASKKIGTYNAFIQSQPVQFTGFKLFYKNDLKPPSTAMMTPAQVLSLTPAPLFIQYQ